MGDSVDNIRTLLDISATETYVNTLHRWTDKEEDVLSPL